MQFVKLFPEAWGLPSTESRLMHSAGIQAMGHLMDRIIPRMPRDKNLKTNILSLTKIRDDCAWTEGEWDGLGMVGTKFSLYQGTFVFYLNI